MKTLVHLPADREGGGIVNFLQLVKAMAVAFPQDRVVLVIPSTFPLAKWTFPANMEVVTTPAARPREWGRLKTALFGLRRLAAAHRVDAVWSLNLGAYLRGPTPQVLSVNNLYQVCPWSDMRWHPAGVATRAMIRFFFRRSLAASEGVMAQTEIMKRHVEKLCRAGQRVAVVPKAVEHARAEVAELPAHLRAKLDGGLGRSAFTFLYVATASPHKNHRVLAQALMELKKAGVSARLVVTLNPQDLMNMVGADLAASTNDLIQSGHLIPTGWTDPKHLRGLYAACDGCVMPSVMESLSSSHLEAMDWGLPQATADLPYARDLCGPAALYAAPDNPAAWAKAMRRLATEPALRATLVEAGHRRMEAFPRDWGEAARRARRFIAEIAGIDVKTEPVGAAAGAAV